MYIETISFLRNPKKVGLFGYRYGLDGLRDEGPKP